MSSARSQLKIAGTQKCSPFPPLRTPSFPLPKNKECYSSLGGDRGHPFAQHCSCPAILRCSVGLTMAAFLGTLIGVGKMVASIAQGTSPCAQSARRQHPCCRRLPQNTLSTSVIVPPSAASLQALWSHLLVLPTRLPLSKNLPAPEADLPKVMAASRP